MTENGLEHWRGWIGRSETRVEAISETLVERFRATIPQGLWDGAEVPPGLQWCLGLPAVALDALGPDGHPARGSFLPPVTLQSRMWAGGELRFLGHFSVGEIVEHEATIADVTEKAGSTGTLVFVTIEHSYKVDGEVRISERQDIVFRQPVKPVAVTPAEAPDPVDSFRVSGSTQLFRYSALTFNGHRIHYDSEYARNIEGYPGLVVHGPLQATLILNHIATRLGRLPSVFSFRGQHPLIAGEPYRVVMEGDACWCEKAGGKVTMKARFTA